MSFREWAPSVFLFQVRGNLFYIKIFSPCWIELNRLVVLAPLIQTAHACDLRISTLAGTEAAYNDTHPGVPPRTFDDIKAALLYLAERKQTLGIAYGNDNLKLTPCDNPILTPLQLS
ncbi:MAG: hypothetical protein C4518_02685 [Desulfobacteraceae bacterium]|nr:MAG: hypothetical protein C4518_02685 [Desulfobacteraceae bacterium]